MNCVITEALVAAFLLFLRLLFPWNLMTVPVQRVRSHCAHSLSSSIVLAPVALPARHSAVTLVICFLMSNIRQGNSLYTWDLKTKLGYSNLGMVLKTKLGFSNLGMVLKTNLGNSNLDTVLKTKLGYSNLGTVLKTKLGYSNLGTVLKRN